MENPITVQVVVVSERFLVLRVVTEILTLLTILLLEIAKTLGFTEDIAGHFQQRSPTSMAASLKRQCVSWGFSNRCIYRISSKSAKFGID